LIFKYCKFEKFEKIRILSTKFYVFEVLRSWNSNNFVRNLLDSFEVLRIYYSKKFVRMVCPVSTLYLQENLKFHFVTLLFFLIYIFSHGIFFKFNFLKFIYIYFLRSCFLMIFETEFIFINCRLCTCNIPYGLKIFPFYSYNPYTILDASCMSIIFLHKKNKNGAHI
jgi:hypothetical protein